MLKPSKPRNSYFLIFGVNVNTNNQLDLIYIVIQTHKLTWIHNDREPETTFTFCEPSIETWYDELQRWARETNPDFWQASQVNQIVRAHTL